MKCGLHLIGTFNIILLFSAFSVKCSKLIGLVPKVFTSRDVDVQEVADMYRNDLPSPETLTTELVIWKRQFKDAKDLPATLIDTINVCPEKRFPNIFVLLKIGCTLPVTSCSCERGASTLKRLRNYMRASMSEERLTGLALMHIHYGCDIDLEEIVDNFAKRNPRKLELKNIIFDC